MGSEASHNICLELVDLYYKYLEDSILGIYKRATKKQVCKIVRFKSFTLLVICDHCHNPTGGSGIAIDNGIILP